MWSPGQPVCTEAGNPRGDLSISEGMPPVGKKVVVKRYDNIKQSPVAPDTVTVFLPILISLQCFKLVASVK